MLRKHSTPIIKDYIRKNNFLCYMNPQTGRQMSIERTILDHFHETANMGTMEACEAIAFKVMDLIKMSQMQFINCPQGKNALTTEAEFFLGSMLYPVFVVWLDNQYWVSGRQWFSFD